jgi:hypothetical protein
MCLVFLSQQWGLTPAIPSPMALEKTRQSCYGFKRFLVHQRQTFDEVSSANFDQYWGFAFPVPV